MSGSSAPRRRRALFARGRRARGKCIVDPLLSPRARTTPEIYELGCAAPAATPSRRRGWRPIHDDSAIAAADARVPPA
jgi:hypothetical protein